MVSSAGRCCRHPCAGHWLAGRLYSLSSSSMSCSWCFSDSVPVLRPGPIECQGLVCRFCSFLREILGRLQIVPKEQDLTLDVTFEQNRSLLVGKLTANH